MTPQSPRAHGALHGCTGGAWDAIKSYFEANKSPSSKLEFVITNVDILEANT